MSARGPRILTVDAFTAEPFRGNPAAVCLLDAPADPAWMQSVAAEMNLSETAFLHREGEGFRLRWFTPAVEVKLCGHATLASAHALWEEGVLAPSQPAVFATHSGVLRATRTTGAIELDFPALPSEPRPAPPEVLAAVGVPVVESRFVLKEHMGEPTWILDLGSESAVRGLRPDLDRIRGASAPCVIVTARADSGPADFVSRFFGPSVGVDEDPVTGSAHCALAPYWAEKTGRNGLRGYQASMRGGWVGVRLEGRRVRLEGHAVTILAGTLSAAASPNPQRTTS